ncbi:hypothetical protein [Undibacterium sp. Di24W]|uniref:hypothetical protein n=1 Tax=Undibacterium sp. Di24W TaxID=3413033 RepID=UPI003BF063F2
MATKIAPSKEYLNKFTSPLWDLLDLENCKPLAIIEGEREDYPFIIIDMQHDELGLLAGDQRTAVSTFFILAHQKKISHPRITQPLVDFQISADKQHIYLVSPKKKVRPGEWEVVLKKAINVADALVEADTDKSAKPFPATYTPVGGGAWVHAFWALMSLLFSILFLIEGFGGLLGWIKLDPSRSESFKLSIEFLVASPFAFWGALYYYQKFKKRL